MSVHGKSNLILSSIFPSVSLAHVLSSYTRQILHNASSDTRQITHNAD